VRRDLEVHAVERHDVSREALDQTGGADQALAGVRRDQLLIAAIRRYRHAKAPWCVIARGRRRWLADWFLIEFFPVSGWSCEAMDASEQQLFRGED
jgi:hypothetical protein